MKKFLLTFLVLIAWAGAHASKVSVTFDFNNNQYGLSITNSSSYYEPDGTTMTNENVTITCHKGSGNGCRFWANSSTTTFRIYSGSYVTVTAPGNIKKITVTADKATSLKDIANNNFFTGTTSSATLDCDAPSVSVLATEQVRCNTMTVTYEIADEPTPDPVDAGLSFGDVSEIRCYLNESFSAPTLTKATTADVTYSSSDPSVASVDANTGSVTLNAAGNATITAYAPAVEGYLAGSASYTIYAYDRLNPREFSYTYNGQTLTYVVVDELLKTCKTKEGKSFGVAGNYVSGTLEIPSITNDGENDYSVVAIGNYAFYNCSNLSSVSIPKSVTSIDKSAFQSCSGLTSVTIPNSVISIGESAFQFCSGLTSVTIPNSVTSMGAGVFNSCRGLTSVTIPNSVTEIGTSAFAYCYGLTSVTIPNSVSLIGLNAFANCAGLTSVTIPNSVISIGESAFQYCSGLTSVTLPSSITSIGESAFQYCNGLTSVTLPNSVTSIGNGTFKSCRALTSVTLPNSVTSIGKEAFADCIGLTSVTLPKSVTSIGEHAFSRCYGLTSVNIPNSVTLISSYAFNGCIGLTSVTLPNSVTSIGNNTFNACRGLMSVTIPNSVTSIGNDAFYNCEKLTEIYCSAVNPPVCQSYTFYNVPTTCKVYVPYNSVEAYRNAAYWKNFTDVLPNGPREFTYGHNGETLTYVVVDENAKTCAVKSKQTVSGSLVDIPSTVLDGNASYTVTAIEKFAFQACSSVTSVIIPNTVTTIDKEAFLVCGNLKSITIPNSVTSIGNSAFQGCNNLTSVTLPNSLTSIGEGLFHTCSALASINIPASVTSIGYNAFYGCHSLAEIRSLAITPPTCVSEFPTESSCKLYVPESAVATYRAAEIWKNFTNILPIPPREFSYTYNGQTLTYVVVDELLKTCKTKDGPWYNNQGQKPGNQVYGTLEIPSIASDGENDYSVVAIGNYAFYNCSNLTSVSIPNTVTRIYDYAFYGCSKLSSITIPGSVISIGNDTFYNCSSLTSVVISNNVNTIGGAAFAGCSSLTSIIIPNSVRSIGGGAFYNCKNLVSVAIGKSVTTIGNNAFEGCSSLVKVSYPKSLSNVFSLNRYSVEYEPETDIFEDGFVYGPEKKSLLFVPYSVGYSYSIPYSVSFIGQNAFRDCKYLTSIEIPTSITTIGDYAFADCEGLRTINIPNSVQSIGTCAFADCTALRTVALSNSIKTISSNLFAGCYSLSSIEIPNSVTTIGDYAFNNCRNLISVIIGNNVTRIEKYAFARCINLESITIPKYVESIGNAAFQYCTSLTSINFINSLTSIGVASFSYCTRLTSVNFGKKIRALDEMAFAGCTSLTSVEFPSSLTFIGSKSFENCTDLKTVIIPNSITNIHSYAFRGCSNIKEIRCLANTPPTCGLNAFENVPYYSCKVYVPKNSVTPYHNANGWKKFTNIIGYYVPGGENEALYIQDFFIEPGEVSYMPVRLRAERDYSDFTTDVYLPQGLEAVTAEDGKVDVLFAREDGSHTMSVATQPDGAVRVAVKSVNNASIADNGSDVLFYIRVKANNDLATGPVPVWMRNTSFKDANYEYLFNDVNPHINADGVMGGADVEVATEAVYYNLQGVRVAQPERGQVYICVQGGKARKLVF